MGRSVETPSSARVVCYRDLSDDLAQFADWDDFKEWVATTVSEMWPSIRHHTEREWMSNETEIIAYNDFVKVTISEYCGVCCIALVPVDFDECVGYEWSNRNLAQRWIKQVSDNFYNAFKQIEREGVMSNGCAVYRKV